NAPRLFGTRAAGYFKDTFHDFVIRGNVQATNPTESGTKAAAHYVESIPAGGSAEFRLRLTRQESGSPQRAAESPQRPAGFIPPGSTGNATAGSIASDAANGGSSGQGQMAQSTAARRQRDPAGTSPAARSQPVRLAQTGPFADFSSIFAERRREADEFY